VIGASNSLVFVHFIEGNNQMDYLLLLLLDFDDYFSSQMI
jgi:hypothetical protein